MEDAAALAAADQVATVARAHADETESLGHLAPAVADAIHESQLPQWWLPTALGGVAGHPGTFVEIVERIAAGDGSAGWCAGIAIGSQATLSVVDPAAAKELLGDGRGGMGAFAPTGQLTEAYGGFALRGRWPFGSNCQQASWGALGFMRFADGAPIMGPAGPVTGMAFVRRDQFDIDENWDMAGLRGTGSHDVVADTHIAESFASDLFAARWPDDALFRLRMFDLLGPSLGVVPLGIGRAALDAARAHIEATGDQPQRGPKPPYGLDPLNQAAFARTDARLRMTKAYMLDVLDEAYQHGVRGDVPPREVSARIGICVHECLAAGTEAVAVAAQIVGTSALREGAYLERLRRDVQSAGGHIMFAPANLAALGRQAAGMHTVTWPFLPPDDEAAGS